MRISYWSSDVCSSDLLQSQRVEHGGQRFQRRIAILRQCIVECLPPDAGLAGDVAHPLGPCDVAERAGAMPGIVPFHRRFEIEENILRGLQMIRWVKGQGFQSHHLPPSPMPWLSGYRASDCSCLRPSRRSEEHTSELQSLMRISY